MLLSLIFVGALYYDVYSIITDKGKPEVYLTKFWEFFLIWTLHINIIGKLLNYMMKDKV